jgi:hypothetical protein
MTEYMFELVELARKAKCDTNDEDCNELVDEEFKQYAVNNLGWSALFKNTVPGLIGMIMYWMHASEKNLKWFDYDKNATYTSGKKKGYQQQFQDWWKANGFSQHNLAWFLIAGAYNSLWDAYFTLYFIWKLFGWLPSWQKFYLEHIVSNFNWATYGFGLWQMIVAVLDDSSWQSYVGLFFYLVGAYMFAFGEWRLGTDAIRHLDNGYWADARLYPSILYLFGIMDHTVWPEDPFNGKEEKKNSSIPDDEGIEIEDEKSNEDDKIDWKDEEKEIEEELNDEFDDDEFGQTLFTVL